REETGIDVMEHPTREALAAAMDSEASPDDGWGKLVDGLLSKEVEPKLIQPTLITDYPVEMSPFAKRHRTDEGLVERWEAYVGGFEIANAFTELNDPDEQRRRCEQQAEELRRGDDEAQPYDEAFVQALEYGMPPTGGVGLGIDRLVMLLTGASTLREVVLFPAMRSRRAERRRDRRCRAPRRHTHRLRGRTRVTPGALAPGLVATDHDRPR